MHLLRCQLTFCIQSNTLTDLKGYLFMFISHSISRKLSSPTQWLSVFFLSGHRCVHVCSATLNILLHMLPNVSHLLQFSLSSKNRNKYNCFNLIDYILISARRACIRLEYMYNSVDCIDHDISRTLTLTEFKPEPHPLLLNYSRTYVYTITTISVQRLRKHKKIHVDLIIIFCLRCCIHSIILIPNRLNTCHVLCYKHHILGDLEM